MAKGPKRDKKSGRFVAKHRTVRDDKGKLGSKGIIKQAGNKKRVKADRNHSVEIPVDKNGYVHEAVLAARFLQVTEGDRRGRIRNPHVDQSTTAQEVILPGKNGKFKAEDVAKWWLHPNEYDIQGIDTAGANIFRTLKDARKGSQGSQRKIAVVAPNEKDYEMIRDALDGAFTISELKKMSKDGLTIMTDDNMKDAGYYIPEMNIAVINTNHAAAGTTIHEAVHHLRAVDPDRKNVISKGRVTRGATSEDMNAEEATTTAETFIRLDPTKDKDYISYYGSLPNATWDNTKERIKEDRELFLGVAGKPMRGKKAVKALESKFTQSNISNLKKGSKISARQYVEKHR